jgi:hypothetical protein
MAMVLATLAAKCHASEEGEEGEHAAEQDRAHADSYCTPQIFSDINTMISRNDPSGDRGSVLLIGTFNSSAECQAAVEGSTRGLFESFMWCGPGASAPFRGVCVCVCVCVFLIFDLIYEVSDHSLSPTRCVALHCIALRCVRCFALRCRKMLRRHVHHVGHAQNGRSRVW